MVSATKYQCFFLSHRVAKTIYDKVEFEALNKMERALTGEMIKSVCWKIEVDRLGHIINIIK